MKVGILTFYSSINYGAFLQAYALSELLNYQEGIKAELIQLQTKEEIAHYQAPLKPRKNVFYLLHHILLHRTFVKERKGLRLSSNALIPANCEEAREFIESLNYDAIVVGSDEVWRIDGIRGYPSVYFLQWDSHATKFAYAVSGRKDFRELSPQEYETFLHYLKQFKYIGARDQATFDSLKAVGEETGQKIYYNLDPTFIYDFRPNAERGKQILSKRYGINPNKKCVALMFADPTPKKPMLLNYLKWNLDKDTQYISLFEWTGWIRNASTLTPMEWVDVIAAVDCVVTMYFHACCFSIIAGTPFYAIEARMLDNESSKLYNLLRDFDMLQYYSLGLEDAISSGRMIDMIQKSSDIIVDGSKVIAFGKKAFSHFLEKLCDGETIL